MTLSDFGNIASIGSFVLASFGIFKLWPMFREWKLRKQAWDFYVALRLEVGDDIYGRAWQLKPGTREFELAEHMVERGKMFRREIGSLRKKIAAAPQKGST